MPRATRGRGRGGASASASGGRNESQSAGAEGATQEAASANPANSNLNVQNATSEPQVSPNSSPVSAPTETPASTPARAPVQRLDSLGAGIGSTRGSMRGARAGASTGRFKPKAVRRGAQEREQAAREEAERQAMRDRDAAALARLENGNRGRGRGRGDIRGRGGRGRGDAMGRGRMMTAGASGPFSAIPTGADRRPGLFAPGSGPKREGGGGSGSFAIRTSGNAGSKIKSEPGMSHYTGTGGGSGSGSGSGSRVKDEIRDPIYPEEQDEGDQVAPKFDIEQINLISDDEEDTGGLSEKSKGKASLSSGGLRPVRLAREEHKERITMVNTEPAAAAAPMPDEMDFAEGKQELGGMFVDGDEDAEASRRATLERIRDTGVDKFSGVWGNDDEDDVPIVKNDPDEPSKDSIMLSAPDIMEIDSKDTTPAPTAAIGSEFHSEQPGVQGLKTINLPETKSKVKHAKPSNKDKKPVLQTEEDKAEYQRHLEDVQILAEELGGLQTAMASDADGDVDMDTRQGKDKEGRLYLFQFPPILPPLYNPVKKEDPIDKHVDLSSVAPADTSAKADAGGTADPNGEQEEVIIKPDPGAFVVPAELVSEAGFIGKLVVRQSGKVELNWGGTSLELSKGANFDFLMTSVLIEEGAETSGEGATTENERARGYGTGMGRVMGKFIATPDWSALFEKGA